MPIFAANTKYGDLLGVKVADGIYVMNDNKMYVDKPEENDGQMFEPVQDGEDVQISQLAVDLVLNYLEKTSSETPFGLDEDVTA